MELHEYMKGIVPAGNDPHTNRAGIVHTTVSVQGTDVSVPHPAGYRLVSVSELKLLERGVGTELERSRALADKYAMELRENAVRFQDLAIITAKQERYCREARAEVVAMRKEVTQLKRIISFPLKWIYNTLRGRALRLDEAQREKELAEQISLAQEANEEIKAHVVRKEEQPKDSNILTAYGKRYRV